MPTERLVLGLLLAAAHDVLGFASTEREREARMKGLSGGKGSIPSDRQGLTLGLDPRDFPMVNQLTGSIPTELENIKFDLDPTLVVEHDIKLDDLGDAYNPTRPAAAVDPNVACGIHGYPCD